jgi:NAD(P)H-hydrate epimerase
VKVVNAAQMRELDQRAIQRGIPGRELMDRAGKAVADLARGAVRESAGATAVVFAGKGNNGGDGFVAARHLAQWGMQVRVALAARAADIGGDAGYHLGAARDIGVPVQELAEALPAGRDRAALEAGAAGAQVLVDALLGTGVRGQVTGVIGELIDLINAARAAGRGFVIAVDVPSGINADTGAVCGRAVVADHTVTMGLPKLGLLVGDGIAHSGRITIADLGYPQALVAASPCEAELVDGEWAHSVLPRRRLDAHKGDFGRVAVLAGSVGLTGAAALCSMAALRMGAGLVTLGVPATLNDIMEIKLTEVMTRPLPETRERTLAESAFKPALELAHEADVVILGPGLSRHPQTMKLARRLAAAIERPLVLDADGLNALAGDAAPLTQRSSATVCTPHPGEMGRLLGMTAAQVQGDRLGIARRAAADLRCLIVLKGARTIIADPGGAARINPTGNPGMASGGTGDVLSGMIGGLLAQGCEPWDAAAAAVFFHGLAGDYAARERTEQCLIASDLLEYLPSALRAPA